MIAHGRFGSARAGFQRLVCMLKKPESLGDSTDLPQLSPTRAKEPARSPLRGTKGDGVSKLSQFRSAKDAAPKGAELGLAQDAAREVLGSVLHAIPSPVGAARFCVAG